jgi:hypothetical protein
MVDGGLGDVVFDVVLIRHAESLGVSMYLAGSNARSNAFAATNALLRNTIVYM